MGHTDELIPLLADSVSREIMPCDVSEENCFIAEKGFVHRSYAVNSDWIKTVTPSEVILINGERMSISR